MRRDSYARIAAQAAALVAAILGLACFHRNRPRTVPATAPPAIVTTTSPVIVPQAPAPKPKRPATAPEPLLDREAVARAEAEAAAIHAERLRAEAVAADSAERLRLAQTHAASAWMTHRKFASTLRDPGPRIAAASAKGAVLKVERDKLAGELAVLNSAPRPRRKVLIDKSPVARKAQGEEFHFEVRGDRVAFIDLERLLDRVKTDARVQIRLGGMKRSVVGQVGPVGSFAIKYEVGRLDNDDNNRLANFGLTGWEVVPDGENRGETYDAAQSVVSDFSRALNRLDPSRDVVTMWIYPDGFPLYRRLREALHARGFLVAARPLPAGTAIRGSPSGSASAAQ